MNDLFVALGIESWKSILGALLMPPIPFLVMVLVGMRLVYRRRLLAWSLVLTGVAGTWLMGSTAVSIGLSRWLLTPPRALAHSEVSELKGQPHTAVLVLGGGRYLMAPEYGLSNLSILGVERLRYGVWLSKQANLPLAFSGGVGHGTDAGPSEAEIAARIAEREFGRQIKWLEGESRDTGENASRSLAVLHEVGIEHVVLVTHDFHMRRALGAFERAKQRAGLKLSVTPAPMGLPPSGPRRFVDWLPSGSGFTRTRIVLHEWVGRLAGA